MEYPWKNAGNSWNIMEYDGISMEYDGIQMTFEGEME